MIVQPVDPDWNFERVLGHPNDANQLMGRVTALAWSPDGALLATGSGDPSRRGELKLWEVDSGRLVRTIVGAHSDSILGLEFSPDGQCLAAAASDRFMRVFRVADGSLFRPFEGHTHHVLDVAWSADGQILATAGADQVIKLWDFRSGELRKTITDFEKEVTAVSFVGVGEDLLTASGDARILFKGQDLSALRDFFHSAAASSDGDLVVAGGHSGRFYIWEGKGGRLLHSLEASPAADQPSP